MGLFGWLNDENDPFNSHAIDNSDKAIVKRLFHLRLTPDWDKKKLADGDYLAPEAMQLPLPRHITVDIKRESYFVAVDSGFPDFEWTDKQKWEILNSDAYSKRVVGRHIDTAAKSVSDKLNAGTIPSMYGEGIIVPLTTRPASEMDFLVPEEASVIMDLSEKARDAIYDRQLKRYFRQESWRNPEVDSIEHTLDIADDPFMPRYRLGINMYMDIRINGIEADKCNLTITEQYKIIQAIKSHQLSFDFNSDGREESEAVEEMASYVYTMKKLDMDFGLSKSINNLSWYGYRDESYQAVKRMVAERDAERASAQDTGEKKRRFF